MIQAIIIWLFITFGISTSKPTEEQTNSFLETHPEWVGEEGGSGK